MKGNLKISALAAAVAMFAMGTAAASGGDMSPANVDTNVLTDIWINGEIPAEGQVDVNGDLTVGGDVNLDYDYDYTDNFNRDVNIAKNITRDYSEDVSLIADANLDLDADVDLALDLSRTEAHNVETSFSSDESHAIRTNEVSSNIVRNETGRTDVRSERDEHGVSVNIDKSLSLDSDITFSGDPTLSGDIVIDSAAIALIDNRQSNTGNVAANELVTNDASIVDDTGSAASGNLQAVNPCGYGAQWLCALLKNSTLLLSLAASQVWYRGCSRAAWEGTVPPAAGHTLRCWLSVLRPAPCSAG